jgi:hypothetical protein
MAAGEDSRIKADWRTASRQSAGLAPPATTTREAVVQVYAARAFSWRGVFAVHTWISIKPKGASEYTTYEVMGWHVFHGGDAAGMFFMEAMRCKFTMAGRIDTGSARNRIYWPMCAARLQARPSRI